MKTLESPALERIFDLVGQTLTPEVASRLVKLRLDAKTQGLLDRLARKSSQGKLSEAERVQYESFVSVIDFVGLLQAQARAILQSPRTQQ